MGVRGFGNIGSVRCKLFANRMIKVFTPSFADHSKTNAQNLEVKEDVARMSTMRFRGSESRELHEARLAFI